MKITSSQAHGGFVRGGRWHENTTSANAVIFFATIFIGMYIWLIALDRKKR